VTEKRNAVLQAFAEQEEMLAADGSIVAGDRRLWLGAKYILKRRMQRDTCRSSSLRAWKSGSAQEIPCESGAVALL